MASQEDITNTSFLDDCISKENPKKPMRIVYEALDLYAQSTKPGHDPEFHEEAANSLQKKIKEIAAAFKASYRNDKDSLTVALKKDNAFAEQVQELGNYYGPLLWGDVQSQASRYRGQHSPEKYVVPELEWANTDNRNSILFYIRCWITMHVVQEPTSRKGKGRASVAARVHTGIGEQLRTPPATRATAATNLPIRAPEVPRMLSATEISRPELSIERANSSHEDSVDALPTARRLSTTISNKRKAQALQAQSVPGKLQKVTKGKQRREGLTGTGDVYMVPQSPKVNFPALVGKTTQRDRRKAMCDTDRTWLPLRGMTVETAYDLDDVMGEIPTLASDPLIMDSEVPFPVVQSPTAGPSGRYRDPQRDDSVISPSTVRAESYFEFEQAAHEIHIGTDPPVPIESCGDFSTPLSSNIDLARLASSQTKKLRSELFKLLLRHLNNIDQFSPESFEPEAEDRLNHLLNHFWLHDTEIIRARLGDRFTQVHTAWQHWMSMRHALSDFQHTTGYFGNPGDEWKEHLRRMDRVSRARASIAYVDLQSCIRSRGDVDERFNDALAIVFDTMTQVYGCNGDEEFSGPVEVYNEGLIGWFS